jgi:glycosyltransferase involved in cell wall biosynthesis
VTEDAPPDLAIFAATSGHSGVDRIVANLLPEFARAGLRIHLLQVRGHGPHIDALPEGVRRIDLGSRHVTTSLWPLYRYLRQYRPRVLMSDKDRANRTALRARMLARVPTRCFVRLGTTVSVNLEAKGRLEAWLQRRSIVRYVQADGVIVPSQGAADDLAHLSGLPQKAIKVLPNPIVTPGLDEFARAPSPHAWLEDPDIPVILGVGSLTPRKDYATLVRAFALLRRKRPCRLIILGEGKEESRLRELAAELGVGEDVLLPGFTPNPYAWMARAAVFAHSSRWEGLGIVLVEALALGIPVISTDCPSGPREVLGYGRHGRLVPVADANALSDAIEAALITPPCAHALRAAASRFRVDAAAKQYLYTLGLTQPIQQENA